MKLGLFTITSKQNYGAALQAYASHRVLSAYGETDVIDVKNDIYSGVFFKMNSPMNVVRNIRALMQYRNYKKQKNRFERFYQQSFAVKMPEGDDINAENLNYDYYITGSDQTFNLKLLAFSPAFYLGFVKDMPKISYASSFGEYTDTFTDADKEFIARHLREYESLSCREAKGCDLIRELTGKPVMQVLDPTLMLPESEWRKAENFDCKQYGEYILFFSVLSAQWVVDRVKQFARETGLKVIAIHPKNRFELHAGFTYVNDIGPAEFLNLIRNAKIVLTASFHGTAFSVLYHKQFYSFIIGEGNRMKSLLEPTGLADCMRSEQDLRPLELVRELDYQQVEEYLAAKRKEDKEFLDTVFGKEKNG